MNKGIVTTIGTTVAIIAVIVHLMSFQTALSREVKADLRDLRSEFKADLRDLRSEFKGLRSEFKGLQTAITDDTDNKIRLHIAEHHQSTAGSGAGLVGALAGDDQAAIPSN